MGHYWSEMQPPSQEEKMEMQIRALRTKLAAAREAIDSAIRDLTPDANEPNTFVNYVYVRDKILRDALAALEE